MKKKRRTNRPPRTRALAIKRPTDGELEILRSLWALGPSTVREVLAHLERESGYTTVLKLLQIMTEKGLVDREKRGNTHVYWAAISQDATQRHLVRDLINRAFPGSMQKLVMQALTEQPASRDELAEIRALLDSLEENSPDEEGAS